MIISLLFMKISLLFVLNLPTRCNLTPQPQPLPNTSDSSWIAKSLSSSLLPSQLNNKITLFQLNYKIYLWHFFPPFRLNYNLYLFPLNYKISLFSWLPLPNLSSSSNHNSSHSRNFTFRILHKTNTLSLKTTSSNCLLPYKDISLFYFTHTYSTQLQPLSTSSPDSS